MSFTINHQLFTAVEHDSGALGVGASLVHQFEAPGIYTASVFLRGAPAGELTFEASDKAGEVQMNVDLAAYPARKTHGECACVKGPGAGIPVVSTKGYVLFYVSSGSGLYSVRAGREGADKASFDSTKLGKGDLYALSLLEPADYTMTNKPGKAEGKIKVTFKKADAKLLRTLETAYVESFNKEFQPAGVAVISTQGLVFRIQDSTRIQVKRNGERPVDRTELKPIRYTFRQPEKQR